VYLVAIMDWYSRYVLSWEVSINLEANFCVTALDWALKKAKPAIFNSDQGAQFTSQVFTNRLSAHGIAISMDGKGRALDNVFVERLWRTLKYEDIYLKDYLDVGAVIAGLREYFWFYNHERSHQALGYRTPALVYEAG
jgi:putative transposase